jgi:hypothetical protein
MGKQDLGFIYAAIDGSQQAVYYMLVSIIGVATVAPVKKGTQMPTTGEKPGKGAFKCKKCGEIVRLDDDADTLPPCPKCNGTDYDKVG